MKTKWIFIGLAFFGMICFFLFPTRYPIQGFRDLATTDDSEKSTHAPSDQKSKGKSFDDERPSVVNGDDNDEDSGGGGEEDGDGDKGEPVGSFKEAFSKKYSSGWDFQETKKGKVFRIIGGKIKGIGNSREAIEGLTGDLAKFAGVTDQSFSYISQKETNLSTTHFVKQFFGRYEVYDAWVQATSNKEGDVFIIENFVKDVDKDISTEIQITQKQALKIVVSEYGEEANVKEIGITPEIWVDDRPHELVCGSLVYY